MLVLPRLQRFSITLKRRQRAKIKFILALCQQSEKKPLTKVRGFLRWRLCPIFHFFMVSHKEKNFSFV
ncbi:hypothetical protein CTV98_017325 [Bacillus altitudinis]|nr:hypothetical protein CTV98_017325 [Bacillus altitudinis]